MGEGDAGVDERARREDRTGLFCGGFEGEVREESGRSVICEGNEVGVCGAALDGADDEFTNARDVL